MDAIIFEHHTAARSPVTAGVFVFAGLFTIFGAVHGAPAIWCAFPGISALLSGWQLVANPKSGVRLTSATLLFAQGRLRTEVALADISRLVVTEWTDGAPSIRIIMRKGKDIHAPGFGFGVCRQLLGAMRALGVEVTRG